MSDVRLVATNPEDSSLVPVACNSRGEMMIVEPTIEKISNDVEIVGDLTVTGTINGDDGGSGLPAPGPEGSILAIENGAPAWVGKSDLCAPDPSIDQVIILGDSRYPNDQAVAVTADGNENLSITDLNEHLRSLPSWDNPSYAERMGVGKNGVNPPLFDLEFRKVFGYVCELTCVAKSKSQSAAWSKTWTFSIDPPSDNISPINISKTQTPSPDEQGFNYAIATFSFLCTRDDFKLPFKLYFGGDMETPTEGNGTYLQRFELIEPSRYLMREFIKEKRKEAQAAGHAAA
jgi:hypothetical protein